MITDEQYGGWISALKERYQRCQIKASVSVNREMLVFYWCLGRDIINMKAQSKWGEGFIRQLSNDLQREIPNTKGFSRTNLLYMVSFYQMYCDSDFVPQLEGQIMKAEIPQAGGQSKSAGLAQAEALFMVPWGHHKLIIDRCKGQPEKAWFYVHQTIQNNWSRALLLNWLDTDLYERQGKAITNFNVTLPQPQRDLAQEMTRDPYNFDFLILRTRFDEKELKDALMDNIQRFLLELGNGFAFMGREYRLVVGHTEQFLDMLFYNTVLHCYVVVEVKVSDFDPRDMGQLSTYVAAVDGILRKDGDQQTVGLLICKTKDNVLAQYAVNGVQPPIGISEFKTSHLIPEDFRGSLPTIEDIERELRQHK